MGYPPTYKTTSFENSRSGLWRCVAYDGDIGIRICPQSIACAAHLRVPGLKLGERDAVLGGNGGADLVLGHEVEGIAVVYNVRLSRRRSCDTIRRFCSGGPGRGRRGGSVTDDGYTSLGLTPERATATAGPGIPSQDLGKGYAVCVSGSAAGILGTT